MSIPPRGKGKAGRGQPGGDSGREGAGIAVEIATVSNPLSWTSEPYPGLGCPEPIATPGSSDGSCGQEAFCLASAGASGAAITVGQTWQWWSTIRQHLHYYYYVSTWYLWSLPLKTISKLLIVQKEVACVLGFAKYSSAPLDEHLAQ